MKKHTAYITAGLLTGLLALAGCQNKNQQATDGNLLVISQQGSFAVGGTVKTNPGTFDNKAFDNFTPVPEGQSYHGDHAYVFYQVPENARSHALVMLHGFGQSSRTWETTPDGREGFQNIFLRRGFPVYLVDQPRRGKAGRGMEQAVVNPTPDEQMWYDIFRIGQWPEFFEGSQFPQDAASIEQFFRQMTPNIGPGNDELVADAIDALFDRIGPGVLITHSAGGGPGWMAGIENPNVKAIVSYEPGNYPFPENEMPEAMSGLTGTIAGMPVPMDDFLKLTKIPIVMYFGDYIPEEVTDVVGYENWRTRLGMARKFVEAINRHGGDATVVELPKIGIYGNSHFMFAEKNNVQIADLLSQWLKEKKLDLR